MGGWPGLRFHYRLRSDIQTMSIHQVLEGVGFRGSWWFRGLGVSGFRGYRTQGLGL